MAKWDRKNRKFSVTFCYFFADFAAQREKTRLTLQFVWIFSVVIHIINRVMHSWRGKSLKTRYLSALLVQIRTKILKKPPVWKSGALCPHPVDNYVQRVENSLFHAKCGFFHVLQCPVENFGGKKMRIAGQVRKKALFSVFGDIFADLSTEPTRQRGILQSV